ncbi:MAG: Transcriptional regulator, partial [Caulobacteraceae bacterium]|nr:Transcriptional regulator [Caulobacteraceae bacterium]
VGVTGALPEAPAVLAAERLLAVSMITVVAPSHPLAALPAPIPAAVAREQVQLVLTDRSNLTEGQDRGVVGKQTWRLADLGAKHIFLREGLGWGHMPAPLVADDLARGDLVRIAVEGFAEPMAIPMSAIFRKDSPPGRIGRWFIERLREG